MDREFDIVQLTVNDMEEPLGTDQLPVFGWRMEAKGENWYQKAYHLVVTEEDSRDIVWDTGVIPDRKTQGIRYQGKQLKPCTRYGIVLSVWGERDICQGKNSWFETGFLNGTGDWSGAKYISTPGYELCSAVAGIFCIEAEIKIPEGSTRGGIVFGKNDQRLLDKNKNIFGVEGEHSISYVIDIEKQPAMLYIYRVGYSKEDSAQIPFACVPVADVRSKKAVITTENRNHFHKLSIAVYGNHAKTFVDGICVDDVIYEEEYPLADGEANAKGRILNPLGINDVITFPRMNEVGFTVENGELHIKNFVIRNIREPESTLVMLPGENEFDFLEKGYLKNGLQKENGYYRMKSEELCQITVRPDYGSVPLVRRGFDIGEKKLKRARLYVTAHGIYEGEINGKKLSDEFFCPGASQFDKHMYYQTYDLTNEIKPGKNAVSFYVSSGWWSNAQTYTLLNYNYYGDKPAIMAKLQLWYADGSTDTVVTDDRNWKCSKDNPFLYAGFFNGEHYDGRKEELFSDKSMASYDDSGWLTAAEFTAIPRRDKRILNWPNPNQTEPEYLGQPEKGVKAVEVIVAKSCFEPRKGVYVYDMGQNMAGVPRISFSEKEGQVITLRYGEMLYPDLEEYRGLEGMILTENLRDADCTDVYICGKEEIHTYMPRFTFHGYRYIEITGVQNPPGTEQVEGVVLSSVDSFCGNIETSDPLINRLFQNICWSQRANFISIPTDCPQRNERMGWLGDAQVFVRTALYNADLALFFKRYLQAVRDLQTENGRFQDIAPVGGGFGGIAWGCAGVIIPWEIYQQYGDTSILEENFAAMQKYVQYLNAHRTNGLVDGVGFLGDWLATDQTTDQNLIWDAIYAHVLRIFVKTLRVLGNASETEYAELYQITRQTWNDTYIDTETGKTCTREGMINDTQCSYALPLAYGILTDENKEKAGEHLNRRTIEEHDTLTTGFLGTGVISEALCSCGYVDTAYRLLKQREYPSWLYSITQGATTIWERWNSYTKQQGFGGNNSMNSFNHYSLGAIGAWMYTYMLGIRRDEEQPGFQRFILQPEFGSLKYVKGFYQSRHGQIQSAWRVDEDIIHYSVTVPANTMAKLRLPDRDEQILKSGSYEFVIENDKIALEV